MAQGSKWTGKRHPHLLVLDAGCPAEDDDGARGLGHQVHVHLTMYMFLHNISAKTSIAARITLRLML